MRTNLHDLFDIEYPIAAFSHCRDVVAAVTNSGGLGVFGAAYLEPDELELELQWIDDHVDGKPYGIDMLFPATQMEDPDKLRSEIPQEHQEFSDSLARRFEVPDLPDSAKKTLVWGPKLATAQWEVSRRHNIHCVVTGLGPLPSPLVEQAHDQGIKVGGMVGTAQHARRHVDGGADFVVAQGTEAGGHTGEISTLVLVPQVVAEVAPVPVLAAGGIGTGRQIAATLTLGAQGVWTGSIWLTTNESDLHPAAVEKLLEADSRQTMRSRARTGKTVRQLVTPWVEAWESEESPKPLKSPYQRLLVEHQLKAISEYGVAEPIGSPVGQIVGAMNQRRSVQQVMHQLVEEYVETVHEMASLFNEQLAGLE